MSAKRRKSSAANNDGKLTNASTSSDEPDRFQRFGKTPESAIKIGKCGLFASALPNDVVRQARADIWSGR